MNHPQMAGIAGAATALLSSAASGQITNLVNFALDASTLPDSNGDMFVNGDDYQLSGISALGMDGVEFTFTPTNNFVGFPRFFIDDVFGLQFGGGGGSSVAFEFTSNTDIMLEGYIIPSTFLLLGNPEFTVSGAGGALARTLRNNWEKVDCKC